MEPAIVERQAQPYVSITARTPMRQLGEVVPPLNGEVFGWLAERGIRPAGPALWKYNVIDMAGELQIEFGAPVAAPVDGDGQIQPGTAPAGRYLVLRHTGPYDQLIGANAALADYAKQHGIAFAARDTPAGQAWDGRFEHYLTDPTAEPDAARWQTDVAYLIAGAG